MTWRKLLVLVATALLAGGCAKPIAGTATWPGARLEKVVLTPADFPRGSALRTHHPRARPGRRCRRAARDAVSPERLRGRADPGDRRLGRTRPWQRGGVPRRLRRCTDGHHGVDMAAGPRPVGRGGRSVRQVRDVLRPVDPWYSDDHHENADRAGRRAGARADHEAWAMHRTASTSRSRTSGTLRYSVSRFRHPIRRSPSKARCRRRFWISPQSRQTARDRCDVRVSSTRKTTRCLVTGL